VPIFIRRLSTKLYRLKNSLLLTGTLFFILVTATLAYLLEPVTFGNWFNAFYWVLTTMATVGYGDYYAHTPAGKILTICLYVLGIGLLSLIISKIIDAVSEYHRRREAGKLQYSGSNHILIMNWSRKALYAIEELISYDASAEIVIVDELDKHPYDRDNVHFVSGDPTSEEVLGLAGVSDARSAIIFADPRIDDPSLVDGKSLMIASTIESIAPSVHTTVEIMLEKHIPRFQHIRVNGFVLSHDAVSRLAVRSAMNEGNIEIFNQLLSRAHGADIYQVAVRPEWRTYGDAFRGLLASGATLLSDRGDLSINRKLDQPIPPEAKLFVVCEEEIHHSLMRERR
jgi:voltage-gated potassium channel